MDQLARKRLHLPFEETSFGWDPGKYGCPRIPQPGDRKIWGPCAVRLEIADVCRYRDWLGPNSMATRPGAWKRSSRNPASPMRARGSPPIGVRPRSEGIAPDAFQELRNFFSRYTFDEIVDRIPVALGCLGAFEDEPEANAVVSPADD